MWEYSSTDGPVLHPVRDLRTVVFKVRTFSTVGVYYNCNSITESLDMSLSKLWETVEDRGAGHAIVHGVAKSWTRLSDWAITPPPTISLEDHHVCKRILSAGLTCIPRPNNIQHHPTPPRISLEDHHVCKRILSAWLTCIPRPNTIHSWHGFSCLKQRSLATAHLFSLALNHSEYELLKEHRSSGAHANDVLYETQTLHGAQVLQLLHSNVIDRKV